MTTVGYGDSFPVSAEGKVLACFTMLSGITHTHTHTHTHTSHTHIRIYVYTYTYTYIYVYFKKF